MRYTFTTIAILLTLLPVGVHAQCPERERTRDLAGKTPIGHYAKEVVERLDEGIERAKNEPGGSIIFDLLEFHMLYYLQSIYFMLVDTELRVVQHSANLPAITACLHADLAIIEAKIEEIRCETNIKYDEKSPSGIEMFEDLALFANASYQNLLLGSVKTDYEAGGWQNRYSFDEQFDGFCCISEEGECREMNSDNCASSDLFYGTRDDCLVQSICFAADTSSSDPEYEPICPFDSDYLSPNTSGYGCDQTVLGNFNPPSDSSIEKEKEAMDDILEMRDEFLDDIEHIKDAAEQMDDILNNELFTARERIHLQLFGTARVDEIEHKHAFGCEADVAEDEDEVKPSRLWSMRTLRGPFFYTKDHIGIWKSFFNLNHYWASYRENPNRLKDADEFPEEDDRRDRMKEDQESNGFFSIARSDKQERLERFVHSQATDEAGILPKAQDVQSEVIKAMEPVRPQMKKNIDLIKDKEGGLRKFVKNYAYFLRRSCIFRPCNTQLDQILKIVLSDECFPYTSGAFITGKNDGNLARVSDNTWEDCKTAVESL